MNVTAASSLKVVEVAGKLHEGPPKTAAGRRAMRLPPSPQVWRSEAGLYPTPLTV